jgi:DNA-binding CsgD family transcriptional regulator
MVAVMSGSKYNENLWYPQNALPLEIEAVIIPLLEKLKEKLSDPIQTNRLIELLENNLQHLVKAYGVVGSLSAAYQRLSPVEKRVSAMVRQGFATKEIATALTISPGTVSIHRKHIRKKMGLNHKKTNLRSYLASLS